MSVCVRACVRACVRTYMHQHTHTHTHTHKHTHTHTLQVLREILTYWQRGSVTAALKSAVASKDDAVLCGFLGNVYKQAEIWTMDHFLLLLPAIVRLLNSESEECEVIALQTAQVLALFFFVCSTAHVLVSFFLLCR